MQPHIPQKALTLSRKVDECKPLVDGRRRRGRGGRGGAGAAQRSGGAGWTDETHVESAWNQALENIICRIAFQVCFQSQLAPLLKGELAHPIAPEPRDDDEMDYDVSVWALHLTR